jgi:hypothetical protein
LNFDGYFRIVHLPQRNGPRLARELKYSQATLMLDALETFFFSSDVRKCFQRDGTAAAGLTTVKGSITWTQKNFKMGQFDSHWPRSHGPFAVLKLCMETD